MKQGTRIHYTEKQKALMRLGTRSPRLAIQIRSPLRIAHRRPFGSPLRRIRADGQNPQAPHSGPVHSGPEPGDITKN